MHTTDRIQAIAQRCRVHSRPFPEPLITALCQYLAGEGSLTQIQQEWKAAGKSTTFSYDRGRFIVPSDPEGLYLDELDRRILDLCIITETVVEFFCRIARGGPVKEARDYLLAQGVDDAAIIKACMECHDFVEHHEHQENTPTALGRLVLSYIPTRAEDILNALPSGVWKHVGGGGARSRALFRLLFLARPEQYLDLAWQVTQRTLPNRVDDFAAELLKADPARFTEWARELARASMQSYPQTITALLELDPGQHIDVAIEAAHLPLEGDRLSHAPLQCIGVEAAYRCDPMNYLSLVEEAAVAPNADLGTHAVTLLKEADFAQARPILQRCIASGDSDAALDALDALLEHEWPERQAYLLSLLSHRSKQVRDALIVWLVKAGEGIIEPLASSLAHSSADARLTAVQALQRIGGEQARARLSARLDAEKSLKVKQAILDAVGVAAWANASESAPAFTVEALLAEAEAALKRIAKPILPWFNPAQMPGLRWKDGEPVPPVVLSYLCYCQSRVKPGKLDTRVQHALPLLDHTRSGDLALALFNGWLEQGATNEQSWCLPLLCALADERLIPPLRQSIDGWAKATRRSLAAKAARAMALIESDLALAEVNDLAERARHSQVQDAAEKALSDAATARHVTVEELSDLIAPSLGFDEQGERLLDYGPRQFIARLQLDQTVQITDSAGKHITSLPRPGARDDQSKARAALTAWSLLKKQVPQVAKVQTLRLEKALINQRAWSAARWQVLFLKHPVLRSLAVTLVWGVAAPGQAEYQALFRPLEDGSLTDAADNTVQLPAEGTVRLAHPVELDEATRSAWLQHLADYEVAPPFPQLNRPIVYVSPDEFTARWWEHYQGYTLDTFAFISQYTKAGWKRGSVEDPGSYYTIWKGFPTAGFQAVLEMGWPGGGFEQLKTRIERLATALVDMRQRGSSASIQEMLEMARQGGAFEHTVKTTMKRLAFVRADTRNDSNDGDYDLRAQDERIIKLGDVPLTIFSEVAADVQAFAAAGEYVEDWERHVW